MIQLLSAGVLSAVVAFATAFAIVIAGLAAAGASPAEAASGLFALCLATGALTVFFSLRWRMPIVIAWSTPGAALLIVSGAPEGGYPAAVGAFLAAAAMMVVAGIWRPFGRAVASIPTPLANAMLGGILLDLCLAPVRAVGALPALALPIIVAWALAYRFARFYAVPAAVLVAAVIIVAFTPIPPAATAGGLPALMPVMPAFTFDALVGTALPLFIVTMASQSIPGLAVLNANGYRPPVRPIFAGTGIAGLATAVFGAHSLSLVAITAALTAGPEAHPDPARRFIAAAASGVTYVALGFGAAFAAAFIAESPPLLIQAVAGLALLGSFGSALSGALASDDSRLPAVITFVVTASGIPFLGVSAAFWGLVAGGALMVLLKHRVAG